MNSIPYLLGAPGHLGRITFRGACNEPQPSNWQAACRRWANHSSEHHTWSPRTGTDHGRHPFPAYHNDGRRGERVIAWGGPSGRVREDWMLDASAYVAPVRTDAEMVALIKAQEAERRVEEAERRAESRR